MAQQQQQQQKQQRPLLAPAEADEMLNIFNQYTASIPSSNGGGGGGGGGAAPAPASVPLDTGAPVTAPRKIAAEGKGAAGMSGADLLYYAHDRLRTFHDLVQLVTTYDSLSRDERRRVQAPLCVSLSPAEKAICEGSVTRRPVRDVVRALTYGARLNMDLTREVALERLAYLGLRGIDAAHVTDKVLVKNVDLCYDYPTLNLCEWLRMGVTSHDVQNMLKTNVALKGRPCRNCVHALLRLTRNGLNSELARFDVQKYLDEMNKTVDGTVSSTSASSKPGVGVAKKRKRPVPKRPSEEQPNEPKRKSGKVGSRKSPSNVASQPQPPVGASMPDLSSEVPTQTLPTTAARAIARLLPIGQKAISKHESPAPMSMGSDEDDSDVDSFMDTDDEFDDGKN